MRAMRHALRVGLFVLALFGLLGCSSHRDISSPATRVARTSGSAVALSRDERIAVVTNRSAGSVSIFSLVSKAGQTQATIVHTFDTGAGSEPWASVISREDDTAYVLFRNAQTVRRLTGLHGNPALEDTGVAVGAEPSAILITPSGKKLFVANFGDGTLSVITTSDLIEQTKIDLNQVLVNTGVLGSLNPRLALAHPRALAITDNGDDDDLDETLYATEFFSQSLPGVSPQPDLSDVDYNRQGFVYPVSMHSGQPGAAVSVGAVKQTGFADSEGRMTSCFPNQLYAAAVDHARLYVTSMCTSPRGPLGPTAKDGTATDRNFKTLFHPAVFVVDTATNQELPLQGHLLTQVLDAYYQPTGSEDPADERMPLIPNDIAFIDAGAVGSHAYLSALGADALYRLDYDASGRLTAIGDPGARYIDLQSAHGLPVGLALSKTSNPAFALAVTDAKLYLSIADLTTNTASSIDAISDPTAATTFRKSEPSQGRGFFGTGRDLWSIKGQAWSSCESCHPGGLSDGVTWYFARGPRRTISTAGTYDKNSEIGTRTRRMLLWGANIDELHDVESIVRGVSGGVGAELWAYAQDDATNDCRLVYDGSAPTSSGKEPCFGSKQTTDLQNGLNGALSKLDPSADETGTGCHADDATCDEDSLADWRMIDSFIRAERAPRAASVCTRDGDDNCLSSSDVAAGRVLFEEGRCAGCHGGPRWTVSKLFYAPGAAQNGEQPSIKPTSSSQLQLGALRTSTYTVPAELLPLNPAASAGSGRATFRKSAPSGSVDSDIIDSAYSSATDDQIGCSLRDVGTFPAQPSATTPSFAGISPVGAPGVFEYRQDMTTLAQGATGFNVPSLFGLSLGAPYFHAGNARTLEEVFDSATFASHHQALASSFLGNAAQRDVQIAQLVAFLLSIDETTELEQLLTTNAAGSPLNHDFCQ